MNPLLQLHKKSANVLFDLQRNYYDVINSHCVHRYATGGNDCIFRSWFDSCSMIPRKLARTDSQNTDLVLSSMCKSFTKVGVSLGFSGGGGARFTSGGATPPLGYGPAST